MSATTAPLAHRTTDLVGSVIDSSISLLANQTHDVVRFAMGAPGDELIPGRLFDRYYGETSPGKYGYGHTEGQPDLIEQVLALLDQQGVPSSADRITVTTGGMQGLDLACKLFVDPGDLVIVEGPTYTNGNIRVNAVAPGMTRTPLYDTWLGAQEDPEAAARAVVDGIPLGRLATAEDVAGAVAFFASPDARYITGVTLAVDGGYTAR